MLHMLLDKRTLTIINEFAIDNARDRACAQPTGKRCNIEQVSWRRVTGRQAGRQGRPHRSIHRCAATSLAA